MTLFGQPVMYLDYYMFFIYNTPMIGRFWTKKMDSLPGDILDRLEFASALPQDRSLRCFLAGFGWEKFLAELTKYLNCPLSKIFISLPNTQSKPIIEDEIKTAWGNNLFILPTQPTSETSLTTFPPNTFDLIIFLWLLSPTQPNRILKQIHQALKFQGQFALVTSFDGSPRLVFSILKQTLKQVTSPRLKLYPSNLPFNARQLRKLVHRSGFKKARIWSDTIKCDYPNGPSIFNDLLKLSPVNLFYEPVKAEDKRFIQERFIELIENLPRRQAGKRGSGEPSVITVNFDFGCATGFK